MPQVVPQPEAPTPSANEELLKGLQTIHDAAANLLRTQDMLVKYIERKMLQSSWLTLDLRMLDVPTVRGSAKRLKS